METIEKQDFATLLRSRVRGYGDQPFAEVGDAWYTGDDLTGMIDAILGLLGEAGVPDEATVALVVRNRLPHAAAILGLVGESRSFSLVYAFQSPEAMAEDIARLRPAAVIADREDWTPPVVRAAREIGTVGIALTLEGERVTLVPDLAHLGQGPFGLSPEESGVEVLTSGTTGPPKRVHIRTAVLERAAITAAMGTVADPTDPPDLVFWPFGGIGGISQVIGAPYAGKRMVLLEKFSVQEFVSAIKRYRLGWAGGQPAVVRMLLDADVPKEDLASLAFFFGGSGPLDPETKVRFEEKYGIPVFWAYGATEFAGTVIAWTPDLYREHGQAKRASSGRPVPGVSVRIVDPATGEEAPRGEVGLLEAKVALVGPDWIRTTDLASMDEDDFVTLHGRADGAINRGGFKILPETVQEVLVQHPAVLDACVVGVPDARLGEVPFAAVELQDGAAAPTQEELQHFVRERLPAHHVPTEFRIVDGLPRTPSLKVSLQAVRALAAG